MAFLSGTRLHLRSWRYFLSFFIHSQRSARQARASDGNLRVELHRDSHAGYWTCTLWLDEAAMRAFMMSGAHATAMRNMQKWTDEAYVVHWTQDSSETPSWAEISRRMNAEGRTTKLRHPSRAHDRFEVPELL